MKIAIIEDENLAAERLEQLLRELDPSVHVEARLPSVEASVQWLRQNTPDLILLDIQLADGLSFEIFEEIDVDAPIIFTTAYDDHALKAFKLNSVDYLLKPIRKEELGAALEKYRKRSAPRTIDIAALVRSLQGNTATLKKRFLIQFGEKIRKVEIGDVAYFYALEKNVFLVTKQNQKYPLNFTLDKLQEMIDEHAFFRINRKMIISFGSIQNMIPYSRSRIKVELQPPEPSGVEALVSVERTSAFKQWLDQ
jgi:two-component system, LytTR family, response regulator LytT